MFVQKRVSAPCDPSKSLGRICSVVLIGKKWVPDGLKMDIFASYLVFQWSHSEYETHRSFSFYCWEEFKLESFFASYLWRFVGCRPQESTSFQSSSDLIFLNLCFLSHSLCTMSIWASNPQWFAQVSIVLYTIIFSVVTLKPLLFQVSPSVNYNPEARE